MFSIGQKVVYHFDSERVYRVLANREFREVTLWLNRTFVLPDGYDYLLHEVHDREGGKGNMLLAFEAQVTPYVG
jgi:hypothetical protein